MDWIIIWACVIALAIIIEIESFSLVSAWFVGGGAIALILAMFDEWTTITWAGWMVQVIVFVVVSLGLLLGCRPFTKKFLTKSPTVPTNADMNIGRKFKLLGDVKGGRSTVEINDVIWTVQVDGEYKAGDFVILKEISGNKYIAEGFGARNQKDTDKPSGPVSLDTVPQKKGGKK